MTFFSLFQCLFSSWLSEREEAVNKIRTTGFKDKSEILSSHQKLTVCILNFQKYLEIKLFNGIKVIILTFSSSLFLLLHIEQVFMIFAKIVDNRFK